jgi:hypothetical protein
MDDEGLDVIVERSAGLDVHKDMVAVCVRVPGPGGEVVKHVAEFGTFTADLLALRDWLVGHGVTRVGMGRPVSTGSHRSTYSRTPLSAGS